jgi:hypothetical protein
MSQPKRFLHIMGDAPIMMVTEVAPEFSLDVLITTMRANGHYYDGKGLFIPYHAVRCIMLTTGETPPAVPGYPADGNVVQFPLKGAA